MSAMSYSSQTSIIPHAAIALAKDRKLLLSSASVLLVAYTVLGLLKRRKAVKRKPKTFKGPEDVGLLIEDGNDVPEYDVIVIGGGTAGCVLASRLSEDPSVNVLVLEAGGSGKAIPETRVPPAYGRLFHNDKYDYDFYTVEQHNAGGRKRYWPRAKMLGGCSSINAQMFQFGAPTDYDEWADNNLEGSSGWAFSEFQKYFLKFEKFVPHKLFPKVDASLRGSSGPVEVGYFGYLSNISRKWIEACEKIGIPRVPDVNTIAGTMGVTKVMTYMDKRGQRVSTETAYLTPDVLERKNLTIATHASVKKIVFETIDGVPRATAVEFTRGKGKPVFKAKARKEIILSGGAIHTPQILMVSGVGPAAQLQEHGISVVSDLPGVGQHLMDHPTVNLVYRVKPRDSLMYLDPKSPFDHLWSIPRLFQWMIFGTGPFTSNVGEAVAFVRSTDPTLFPYEQYAESIEDTASGPGAPDIELFSSPFGWKESVGIHPKLPTGPLATLAAVLLRPTSLGSIRLKSADPFEKPIIDPNYLGTRHDLAVLTRGVQLSLRIAQAQPIAPLLVRSDTNPLLDHVLHGRRGVDVESWVRERVETLYHPTSTARMAPKEKDGVVDARLRVYGVKGLRVVDASVFPTIVAGHTAAPTIAVAEKAADMIKEDIVKN